MPESFCEHGRMQTIAVCISVRKIREFIKLECDLAMEWSSVGGKDFRYNH